MNIQQQIDFLILAKFDLDDNFDNGLINYAEYEELKYNLCCAIDSLLLINKEEHYLTGWDD